MIWGLFKKIVIADRLAIIVDPIYNAPSDFNGPLYVFATICFAIQIYCDFSGYSDMAIGSARILGINLMRNFNQPYLAISVADFWRRWHISLSTWFRDYVYIPLGGNRVSVPRWYLNLLIVFLVCGLWHGANWTFVIWGGIHGCYLIFHWFFKPVKKYMVTFTNIGSVPKLHKTFQIVMTFLLVSFAWIFFRANNTSDAFYIINHMGTGWSEILKQNGLLNFLRIILDSLSFAFVSISVLGWMILIAVMFYVENKEEPLWLFKSWSTKHRWLAYWALIITIISLGSFEQSAFIYFQF
jgi:D-alanyl-lipoteichoic acid acyltransferase DltB (MBOAT superfamily)